MMEKPLVNTGVQIAGRMMTVGISLVTTGMLTRKLGVEVYGKFVLITSVFLFFDILADFGTKMMGVREASLAKGRARLEVWRQVGLFRVLSSLGAMVLGALVIGGWEGFWGVRTEAGLALIMVGLTSLAGTLEMVWLTRMEMLKKVIIEVLMPLIFLVVVMVIGSRISLGEVFAIYLGARVVSLLPGWWWERKLWSEVRWNWEEVKRVAKISWPMGLYLLIFAGYDRAIDSVMIERLVGIKQVAWYGLSYKIYSTLIQPAYFLVGSIFPLLSGKMKNKRQLFWKAMGILALGAGMVMVTVWMGADWMVGVLGGGGFEMSAAVLRILMVALLFAYLNHLLGFSLISKKGEKEMLGLGIIVLVFNFGANLLLIPRMGIIGAAWVTVATEAMSGMLISWRLARKI
jgi:O-antigen/teichoic acid export membrane protein